MPWVRAARIVSPRPWCSSSGRWAPGEEKGLIIDLWPSAVFGLEAAIYDCFIWYLADSIWYLAEFLNPIRGATWWYGLTPTELACFG